MSVLNDGGLAFPFQVSNGAEMHEPSYGMTLRDWLAGQAMSGLMAQSHAGPKDWTHMGHGWGEDCANDLNKHGGAVAMTLASFAYQLADAMLAERSKP